MSYPFTVPWHQITQLVWILPSHMILFPHKHMQYNENAPHINSSFWFSVTRSKKKTCPPHSCYYLSDTPLGWNMAHDHFKERAVHKLRLMCDSCKILNSAGIPLWGHCRHQAINLVLQTGKDLGRQPPKAKLSSTNITARHKCLIVSLKALSGYPINKSPNNCYESCPKADLLFFIIAANMKQLNQCPEHKTSFTSATFFIATSTTN